MLPSRLIYGAVQVIMLSYLSDEYRQLPVAISSSKTSSICRRLVNPLNPNWLNAIRRGDCVGQLISAGWLVGVEQRFQHDLGHIAT